MSSRTAFAYTRVSSVGQNDGHGPERQLREIQRFAKLRRLKIVETFHDSHTGTEEHRPAFSSMLAALKSNGTRTVVIERLDRFAREIGVQIALFAALRREGITLLEASTGRDVTAALDSDPMAKALVNIQGVFHQAEKELLVRKLRLAREDMRAKVGRCEGVKPFGRLDGEQPVLDAILEMKGRKGKRKMSLRMIAAELNKLNMPTRSGSPWLAQTIGKILQAQASRAK